MDEAIELAIEERDRNHGGLVRKFAYVSDAGHARFREKRARARRLSRALVVRSDTVGPLCSGDRFATKPAVCSLSVWLPANRIEGGATLRYFPGGKPAAQTPDGVLDLLEHVVCAVEVLGPSAGDDRSRAGSAQMRA
jgi:hypothetical protein